MRYVAVRRVTMGLGGAFLLCAAAFAWLVRDDEPATRGTRTSVADGAVLFDRYCGSCHPVDDLRRELRARGRTRASIEMFLSDHGEGSPAEDRLILDYLEP